MRKRAAVLWLVGLLCFGWAVSVSAQDVPPPTRVLVIDETKTFASTMRVAALVGALRGLPSLDVEFRLVDVASSWDDPLAGQRLAAESSPYDVLLMVPRGIDDGSAPWIWLVTDWIGSLTPQVRASVEAIAQIVDMVFAGMGTATDVSEDLWPYLLWIAYSTKGWIR